MGKNSISKNPSVFIPYLLWYFLIGCAGMGLLILFWGDTILFLSFFFGWYYFFFWMILFGSFEVILFPVVFTDTILSYTRTQSAFDGVILFLMILVILFDTIFVLSVIPFLVFLPDRWYYFDFTGWYYFGFSLFYDLPYWYYFPPEDWSPAVFFWGFGKLIRGFFHAVFDRRGFFPCTEAGLRLSFFCGSHAGRLSVFFCIPAVFCVLAGIFCTFQWGFSCGFLWK